MLRTIRRGSSEGERSPVLEQAPDATWRLSLSFICDASNQLILWKKWLHGDYGCRVCHFPALMAYAIGPYTGNSGNAITMFALRTPVSARSPYIGKQSVTADLELNH